MEARQQFELAALTLQNGDDYVLIFKMCHS